MREVATPSLARRTTLRLGGTALAELVLEGEEDIDRLPSRVRALGGSALVLGRGSNLLAADGRLPLVLVRPHFSDGPGIVGTEQGKVLVRAGAAVPLPRLLRFCAAHGLSGLEGLAGIPGSVGGAVAMNAGSFGTETCAHVEALRVFDGTSIRSFSAGALSYGYRSMRVTGLDGNFIILQATFGLTPAASGGIRAAMRHNFFVKKSKQPVTAWSAGCVFKNPAPDKPAGKLLELSGFKGKKLGGMAFSQLHANFLVNEGRGCAAAALDLLREARAAVQRRFGLTLETEVRIVPCPLD